MNRYYLKVVSISVTTKVIFIYLVTKGESKYPFPKVSNPDDQYFHMCKQKSTTVEVKFTFSKTKKYDFKVGLFLKLN